MNILSDIKEIFSSIQGEGLFVGVRQIFVRFCGCNLSCSYCDTDFIITKSNYNYCFVENPNGSKKIKNPVSTKELMEILSVFDLQNHHSISLTSGEPLLHCEFLKVFLPEFRRKYPQILVYLETNGVLHSELEEVIENIDIVSMDIKLKSSTGEDFPFESHKNFIDVSLNSLNGNKALYGKKEIFLKVVVSSQISDSEIREVSGLIRSFGKDIPLVIQPVNSKDKDSQNSGIAPSPAQILQIQEKFLLQDLKNVRVIPQTHKFLNLL